VFVNPAERRHGIFKRLVRDLPAVAFRLLAETSAHDFPAEWSGADDRDMFIEKNDPFRMPADDQQRDTQFAGLDQVARIGIWARMGARSSTFPYVQPPLSSDQKADENLVCAVLGARGETLGACLLRASGFLDYLS
jgi:hypothetical protein